MGKGRYVHGRVGVKRPSSSELKEAQLEGFAQGLARGMEIRRRTLERLLVLRTAREMRVAIAKELKP